MAHMKTRFLLWFGLLLLAFPAVSGAVVVTGTGETRDEAITRGLRTAVEMFTGSLVYGVTDIEDYQLKKDKIVASSIGYVKNYRIVKIANIDNLITATLDVDLSEDKIETIVRDNINLMTYQDVLRDYGNVVQRQEQMRKFAAMIKILVARPIHEKYFIVYEGYEIKQILMNKVDIILKVRIGVNPFYSRAYNEILANLSLPKRASGAWIIGGNYRIEKGILTNSVYYITDELSAAELDDVSAMVYVDGAQTDACRQFRDNLLVDMDYGRLALGIITAFPKAFMEAWREEEKELTVTNAAIKNSKLLPPGGLPLKIKYSLKDSNDIKKLAYLHLTLGPCKPKEER